MSKHQLALPGLGGLLPPLVAVLCLVGTASVAVVEGCSAQQDPGRALEAAERRETVEAVIALLEERYVFPAAVGRIADSLRSDLAGGHYEGVANPETFADRLSGRLREISGDGHLWVTHQPMAAAEGASAERESPSARRQRLSRSNFGLPHVEVRSGNVGYLDIRSFVTPELAGATAAAAMEFLGNVDALILDVRHSQGGWPGMVALLASYFFDPDPVHLFDLYLRPSDQTDQYWTLSYLPTRRLVEQPIYVLTAANTFSAGEGLAYVLKHTGRATVVGERTAGGANPGAYHRVSDRFVMFVAEGRVTSPVTGDNWQGTGVEPDVEVAAADALDTAHRLALEHLRDRESEAARVREFDRLIAELRSREGGR